MNATAQPLTDISGHGITRHAAERWMRRNDITDPSRARRLWNRATRKATEVWLRPVWGVKALLNHNLTKARYWKSGQWVFVDVDGTVVTVYQFNLTRFTTTKP